jgi:hypothetical protein
MIDAGWSRKMATDVRAKPLRAERGFAGSTCRFKASGREKWKFRIEGAALAVSAADVLIKITQLAVEHLHEFFSPGDEQSKAKNELAAEFPPFFPDFPKSYAPGSRVDWKTLLGLFEDAQHMVDSPHSKNYHVLEQRFVEWFDHLNDYHKEELLAAIAEADNTK